MRFESRLVEDGQLPDFGEAAVKNEPMLFNCSAAAAARLGGPITKAWLALLRPEFRARAVVDTRVHMLMPGWYPCIPGWHHDDVPRSTATGQPNYASPEYKARHCCALLNAGLAPTEFLVGTVDVPEPDPARAVYKDWDDYLEGPGAGQGRRVSAPDRALIYFDADTFHRGTAAVGTGWRWFGRASVDTGRRPTDEVRRQVQIYMGVVNAGW